MSAIDFDEDFYLASNPDVAMAIRAGSCPTAWQHYVAFGRAEGRAGTSAEGERQGLVPTMGHRRETFRFLRGSGVEIGALESPCPVPESCRVTYCDRFSLEEARRTFPELDGKELQAPDVCINLDREGLRCFEDTSQDFVIFNHVIEHVANPIACMAELFRVTRSGGHVVVAAPDKRFTFDVPRGLTSFDHLLEEYRAGATEVTPEHYLDIVALLYPGDVSRGVDAILQRVRWLSARAEHAHVWDSDSFRDFVDRCLGALGVAAERVLEVAGDRTRYEYFAILEKRR